MEALAIGCFGRFLARIKLKYTAAVNERVFVIDIKYVQVEPAMKPSRFGQRLNDIFPNYTCKMESNKIF